MSANQPQAHYRTWFLLSMLWGVWLFGIFSSAGKPFVQNVIWGGALAVSVATLPYFLLGHALKKTPKEVFWLALFWLWSLLGGFIALDLELFIRYSQLILQFVLIVIGLSFIIAQSGAIKPIFVAFIAVGAFLPVIHTLDIGTGFSSDTLSSLERVSAANAVGFQSVLGIVGFLALFPETRSFFWRALLLSAGAIALYGVVLSGSRGALLATFFVFVLWPFFCFRSLLLHRWVALIFILLIGLLAFQFYEFVLNQSNLGRRLELLQRLEDNSTLTRLELFLLGFKLAYKSLAFGVGLGQFGIASGTGYYAHNEFSELLGTTGVVGLVLYYSAYFTTWRRLERAVSLARDLGTLYRINIAKMMLVVMLLSGLLFRPNFLSQDTMFLYALIVGISLWAVRLQNSHSTSRPRKY